LNGAVWTAKQYWSPFVARDFAKAPLPNWVAANQAFLLVAAGDLRCTGLIVAV
jgi:hypothetical protein